MDADQKRAFKKEYNRKCKSIVVAYLAWGILGWHDLYIGRVGMQFAFWFTGRFLIVGWIIDAFRIPGMVSDHNADWARELMAQHKALAA